MASKYRSYLSKKRQRDENPELADSETDLFDADDEEGVLILYSVASRMPLEDVMALYGAPKQGPAAPKVCTRAMRARFVDYSPKPPKYAKINESQLDDPITLPDDQIVDLAQPVVYIPLQSPKKLEHPFGSSLDGRYGSKQLSTSETLNRLNKHPLHMKKTFCSFTVALHLGKLYHIPVSLPISTEDWFLGMHEEVLKSIQSDPAVRLYSSNKLIYHYFTSYGDRISSHAEMVDYFRSEMRNNNMPQIKAYPRLPDTSRNSIITID